MKNFNYKRVFVLFIFTLFAILTSRVIADPFVGDFTGVADDEQFTMTIDKESDGLYNGVILINGAGVQLFGMRQGNQLYGEINDDEGIYEFIMTAHENGALHFEGEDGEFISFQKSDKTHLSSIKNNSKSNANIKSNTAERKVFVNRVQLDNETLQAMEKSNQVPIADGRYWYDANCGAWGVEGGPTAGFILAGLPLPGPMPADISGGGTGIFINGREIHPLDQQALHQLFGVTYQGEFWMDAQGSIGYMGGPAIANILLAAQAKQSASTSSGGSATHGYNSTYGARGTAAGGMYSGRTATGKSVFWYPGM